MKTINGHNDTILWYIRGVYKVAHYSTTTVLLPYTNNKQGRLHRSLKDSFQE